MKAPLVNRVSLHSGKLEEVLDVPIPSWKKSFHPDESQHHIHMERGGATTRTGKGQTIRPPHNFFRNYDGVTDAALSQHISIKEIRA